MRLARDDGRRGRAAIATVPRIRLEDDDDILEVIDAAQRGLEGPLQRYAQLAKFNARDLHNRLRIKYSAEN